MRLMNKCVVLHETLVVVKLHQDELECVGS